jgi:hypothetical protein
MASQVHSQDFRYWTPCVGHAKPAVETKDFTTREAAEDFRAQLPKDELFLVTITATPEPRVRKRRKRLDAEGLGGWMNTAGQRLTP